jgi:hypothetical protein
MVPLAKLRDYLGAYSDEADYYRRARSAKLWPSMATQLSGGQADLRTLRTSEESMGGKYSRVFRNVPTSSGRRGQRRSVFGDDGPGDRPPTLTASPGLHPSAIPAVPVDARSQAIPVSGRRERIAGTTGTARHIPTHDVGSGRPAG